MVQLTTIGLDIAKQVFQAHGANMADKAVLRRKLRQSGVVTVIHTGRRFES